MENTFLNKVKLWWQDTGLTNIVYLLAALLAKFALSSNLLLGAGIGIFLYVNFNVIKKLVVNTVHQYKVKRGIDKIESSI